MKINNLRKKIATTLIAGGLISPALSHAANLNSNLVINGTFENVDLNVTGEYNGPLVLGWTGPNLFAYSHNGSSSSAGVVPDYADGDTDPPGAGNWYFTPNNTNAEFTDVHDPNTYYQDIAVGTGATGTAIAAGKGRVDISGYMSSYLNDTDIAHIRVEFRDTLGNSLGFTEVTDSDFGPDNVWNLNSGSAAISTATASLRVSLYGTRTEGGGGADGYMDNVDVRIIETAAPQFLFLEVNTSNGQASIKNETGAVVNIDYYEITSVGNSLKPTTWSSLQDQNSAGFPAGNGSGNGWEEAGGVSTSVLVESYLTGNSAVGSGATKGLGPLFDTTSEQDLIFSYAVVPPGDLDSDFDGDGDSDGRDFLAWQRGFGIMTNALKSQGDADGDGDVDEIDLDFWQAEYRTSGASGPGVLVTGFVKYVAAANITAVPEPSSMILVGLGIPLVVMRRQNS